jgi:GNAT superfamily N-acetyltransferase
MCILVSARAERPACARAAFGQAQAVGRFGAQRAAWMLASHWVLADALAPHEVLVDFVAVAPEARGRGMGAALMRWALGAAAAAAPPGGQPPALVLWARAHSRALTCGTLPVVAPCPGSMQQPCILSASSSTMGGQGRHPGQKDTPRS